MAEADTLESSEKLEMPDTYLGALNLVSLVPGDALAMAIALKTALKVGLNVSVKIAELKVGQRQEFWVPTLHFYATRR